MSFTLIKQYILYLILYFKKIPCHGAPQCHRCSVFLKSSLPHFTHTESCLTYSLRETLFDFLFFHIVHGKMDGNGWIKFTLKAFPISSLLHFFSLKKSDLKIHYSEVFSKNLSFYIFVNIEFPQKLLLTIKTLYASPRFPVTTLFLLS